MTRKYPICVIGSLNVGKTSLINKAENDTFDPCVPTLTLDSHKIVENIDGNEIILEVYDTAGQEAYTSLMPSFIKAMYCAILCFDPTKPECLNMVEKYEQRFLEFNNTYHEIIYVATKCDTWEELPQDVSTFLKSHDVISTSAMRGDNVHEPFIRAAEFCSKKPPPEEEQPSIPKTVEKKSFCNL